ncbi:PRD domain-containing protein [Clostridium tagluense]|uniref:PRD domain-containing protein n=1 Tax=Clostridium tagluense TaxID=360422 RepID=UPI001C0CDE68|nr:PRD domain-containing protein [Clostridium tagluense]MBU3128117.1 PRD domain-containing protein [Clostridium tagluense]MCB2311746.1 PRD domain-containing protein [Clostridium tagluense]MCB2316532.1 PRD domain-containing protein [Clostridium tagluense]MCB2321326.1 PRD domain-containing protein [Clostridium tagluense]MCB2326401.1 PRD domain-containing protein [Clostridium tagluense]
MDIDYKVLKSLSSNVVVSEKDSNVYVLFGKGIGFGKKPGERITKESTIEQKFIKIDDSEKDNYVEIVKNVEGQILAVTEEIISLAEDILKEKLTSRIHVGLADHISFAMKRMELEIDIVNPFLNEIQTLYPDEYSIAEKGSKLIKEKLNVELPESEIGFITLHIHSARANVEVSQSLKYTRIIKEVMEYIQEILGIDTNQKSMEYARLVSHLRYALDRIENDKVLKNVMLESIKTSMSEEFEISKKVCKFISKKLFKEVCEDEIGYMSLHIYRLKQSN